MAAAERFLTLFTDSFLSWSAAVLWTGLRIDHVDGLLSAAGSSKSSKLLAKSHGIDYREGQALHLRAGGEDSRGCRNAGRKDWPVHGTTGYDSRNEVAQLLIDPSAEKAITKTFTALYR